MTESKFCGKKLLLLLSKDGCNFKIVSLLYKLKKPGTFTVSPSSSINHQIALGHYICADRGCATVFPSRWSFYVSICL